ncbi:permease-like cell division protein FtsX [Eubacterium xylanophilum]|uniref:permease-like cell division protein FtsX n=1 Tax=Eubacterium xylanophilum TaxID=39497 RepID=UPI001FA71BAD|nr:permease-like cell division protein FtsX [Eubacterium xylanophilum]
MTKKKVDITMRGISVFSYCFNQGIKSLKRNRMFTLASVGTISACLLLFGVFYFITSNFQNMISEIESTVGLTVFFEEGASKGQIDSIGNAIKLRKEVDNVKFISAEEAWEKFSEENFKDNKELLDSFSGDNPLEDSASYQVSLKNVATQEEVAKYIETIEGVRSVKRSEDTAKGLENANKMVSYVSVVLIVILLLVSIFLINSTISAGIEVRRQEIEIMRLMGASDFFIRAPFMVEGIVIGFIGAIAPVIVLLIAYKAVTAYLLSKYEGLLKWLSFLSMGEVFSILIPVCFLIGVGIGFLGSYITVRRHISV